MGLYKRKGSRYWWMSYTADGVQQFESTKTTSKALATRIRKKREGEVALGQFKVGWPGERMTFDQLYQEFERSRFALLSESSKRNYGMFLKSWRAFFGERKLTEISAEVIEQYRDHRRRQASKRDPTHTVKGASVNRELQCLHCMFEFARKRKYIQENPAFGVKHFDERRERPAKRLLTAEEELRILLEAPLYLSTAIVLLVQTGLRTYSEAISLRWDQADLDSGLIHLRGAMKTEDSAAPVPLSKLALDTLRRWKAASGSASPYVFPSPRDPTEPIRSVKRAWRSTLRRAGVPYFPIYQLRHAFCTRLSAVAPDAVLQQAMRHSSPETKRHYQLSMTQVIREMIERANERVYGGTAV